EASVVGYPQDIFPFTSPPFSPYRCSELSNNPKGVLSMQLLALYLQSAPDQEAIQRAVLAMMTILPLLLIVGLAIVIVPFWFICKKAGFSPWLSLLNVVPFGNLILIYILAFADWKVVPMPPVAWQQPPYPPQPPFPPQQ